MVAVAYCLGYVMYVIRIMLFFIVMTVLLVVNRCSSKQVVSSGKNTIGVKESPHLSISTTC
jgi:hypothetical protein